MRKELYTPPDYEISIKNPFFYKQCKKCGDSIKREEMWKVVNNTNSWQGLEMLRETFNWKKYMTYYFCNKCFSDENKLIKYLDDNTKNFIKNFIKEIKEQQLEFFKDMRK